MRTAFDLPASQLDAHDATLLDHINSHGWTATHVVEDDARPGFAHTTGVRHSLGKPELVIFSLPKAHCHDLFWDLYNRQEAGEGLPVDRPLPGLLTEFDILLRPVETRQYEAHFGWSRWFCRGDAFPVLQLFLPGRTGRFPWQEGVHPAFRALQPDLTRE